MNQHNTLIRFLYPSFLLAATFFTACKKDITPAEVVRPVYASQTVTPCGDSTLSGVITSNLTLRSCKTYKLSGLVYVANNATLSIEPGTVIRGIKSTVAYEPGGGLIITRGAKIQAIGTATSPIVFTSNETVPAPGDWSGITILGNAPANVATAINVEGIAAQTAPADISFGGPTANNPQESSGALKYVRIEYAGFVLTVDNEMNGLTLAGVGSGTVLDYIEVYKSLDDAFQFFGGTVNASHLLTIAPQDDMFDFSLGYTGKIAYALGISDQDSLSVSPHQYGRSHCVEAENDIPGSTNVPLTRATLEYATFVGLPTSQATFKAYCTPYGHAFNKSACAIFVRRNAQFDIRRSVVLGFNYGIAISDIPTPSPGSATSYTRYLTGISVLANNFYHAYVHPYAKDSVNATPYSCSSEVQHINVLGNRFVGITPVDTTNKGYRNLIQPNAAINLKNPFNKTIPVGLPPVIGNYAPQAASPAISVGAFPGGNTSWASGWTRL